MSVRLSTEENKTALFDSATGWAFGPVFDTQEEAEAFLAHLTSIGERDARHIPVGELVELALEWEAEREEIA